MKILFVITRSDTLGGAQKHVSVIAHYFQSRGDIVLVASGGNGLFQSYLQSSSVPVVNLAFLKHKINLLYDLAACIELAILVFRYNPDIVSAHSFKACSLVRVLAIFRLVKASCITAHGWSHIRSCESSAIRGIYLFLERFLNLGAGAVVTVSLADARFAVSRSMVSASKVTTIYNGIPDHCSDSNPVLQGKLEMVKLVSVMRFERPKDPLSIIRALFLVRDLCWHFTFFGDGPQLESSIALASHLGLSGRISFNGFSANAVDSLDSYDIFVLSSFSEGLPLSIIEAMCSGLPVIASNVGGVSELVRPLVNGLLFEAGDTAGLSSAIRLLVTNPMLATKFGSASRQRYLHHFTSEQMSISLSSLYDCLVSGSRKTS